MIDKENVKSRLKNLLPKILDDTANLKRFVFFFRMQENIRVSIEEVQSVLEDYLVLCSETPMKGNKKVTHIDEKYDFYSEQSIGYIDIKKIETIANAVLDNTGVRLYISLEDFKIRYKKNILHNSVRGKAYRGIIEQYQKGDSIEEIVSPYRTWKQLCGSAAVVLTRNGEYVCGVLKSMN